MDNKVGQDPFSAEVLRISAERGISPPYLILSDEADESFGAFTSFVHSRVEMTVSPRMLNAPEDVQRSIAAHEMAHVDLGHSSGNRTVLDRVVWTLIGLVIVLAVWAGFSWPNIVPTHYLLLNLSFVAGAAVVFFGSVTSRRAEYAADLRAAQLSSYRITADTVRWMRSEYGETVDQPSFTHPSMERRLRRLQSVVDPRRSM